MRKTKTIALTLLAAMTIAVTAATVPAHKATGTGAAGDSLTTEGVKADTARLESEAAPGSVADEVIWVVGDEAILLSDVEQLRAQMEMDEIQLPGNPDCRLPEQIAVQKLFLHQAALDSIEVTEAEVSSEVEAQINHWIAMVGSKEKLEEYRKMPITKIRSSLHDECKNNMLIQRMRQQLVQDIKVTPAEVRRYFKDMPEDSIPFVPTEVEVQIITRTPKVTTEEVNRIKDELRSYTDRVTKGETTFQTLARFYSEDPGTARNGGELGFVGRGTLDPAFAAVAFNLTDPKKISKIVESEFGFHIIQLVEKRGDKINVRHILRKPQVSQTAIDEGIHTLDSLVSDCMAGKFTFDEAATFVSDDKDTRSNRGLMARYIPEEGMNTSRFAMKDLPTEVARQVEKMKVGDISPAFTMVNSRGKTVCAVIRLKARIEGHRADITEDFQVLQNVIVGKRRVEFIHDWVKKKIGDTYVRMKPRYRGGDYEYQGWVQE